MFANDCCRTVSNFMQDQVGGSSMEGNMPSPSSKAMSDMDDESISQHEGRNSSDEATGGARLQASASKPRTKKGKTAVKKDKTDTMLDYLKERKMEIEENKQKREAERKDLQEKLLEKTMKTEQRDPIDQFYLCMAATHKILPQMMQCELEMQVMQAVNGMKMRYLKEQQGAGAVASESRPLTSFNISPTSNTGAMFPLDPIRYPLSFTQSHAYDDPRNEDDRVPVQRPWDNRTYLNLQ